VWNSEDVMQYNNYVTHYFHPLLQRFVFLFVVSF